MGYLDADTITVDAVLTKVGRLKISEGSVLNITAFSLSDTGIDYTLWNADHPSGSAYYGEAIEALPMLEANVHSQYALRNKLITLGVETTALPVLGLSPDPTSTYTFETLDQHPFIATLYGFTGGGSCQLLIANTNVVSGPGTGDDITGNALSFITEADIPTAKLYTINSNNNNQFSAQITPQTVDVQAGANTHLTFIHTTTGAYVTIEVHVNFNGSSNRRAPSSSTQG